MIYYNNFNNILLKKSDDNITSLSHKKW